jgi:hypothetical protein
LQTTFIDKREPIKERGRITIDNESISEQDQH